MADSKPLPALTGPGGASQFNLFSTNNTDMLLPVGIFGILMIMIVPVPPWFMDLLLALSISLSLLILFVGIYTIQPLDFSAFPSLLLVVTLLRLSLNIGTTRLILLRGNDGPDAAGHLIAAFGDFVVGGNYVVGLIIFVILVVINFVVITKGAGRIAEVSARFTLDAMPGKQMSIDADLNAGLINESQARERREKIEKEADFYGAMDGASKFVRGDAIAGIIIMLINLVGGLSIGILQHGMTVADSAKIYMLLTVGDGLVSQIPSLIVSTSAGLVVTRATGDTNLSTLVTKELMLHPRALGIAALMLAFFGILPGMPLVPFWVMAGAVGMAAYSAGAAQDQQAEQSRAKAEEESREEKKKPDSAEDLLPLDMVSLEVGYGLISLVDTEQKGDLLERIRSLRRQFAQEWGFVVPAVHIRDNLELKPSVYSILIKGCEVAGGEVLAGNLLAMATGDEDLDMLPGTQTVEPAFGLPAKWIVEADREKAQAMGFTVVEGSTVIATHITEVLKTHLHELLTRQETQNLIDNLAKKFPKVVEGVVPDLVSLGLVQKVLQNLLAEHVPIRDILTILETLSDKALTIKDPDLLTEHVRASLARHITRQYVGEDNKLYVMLLDREIEELIASNTKTTEQGYLISIDPETAQQIITALERAIDVWGSTVGTPIVITLPSCRGPLRKLTEKFFSSLVLLSHNEIPSNVDLESLGVVELAHANA